MVGYSEEAGGKRDIIVLGGVWVHKGEMMRWRSALKLIVACDMIKNKNEGGV